MSRGGALRHFLLRFTHPGFRPQGVRLSARTQAELRRELHLYVPGGESRLDMVWYGRVPAPYQGFSITEEKDGP